MNIRRINAIVVGIVFSTALAGMPGQLARSAAFAQDDVSINMHPLAGPNRPANVPDGYVITPFGYFHSSCVQSLTKGERLMADGRVQHADGRVNAKAAVCGYPHYQRAQVATNAFTGGRSPEIDGWVENASITTGSPTKSYGALIANWTVPAQPSAEDGQVLYYFPGFEDINNTQSILQPVLGWYQGQWSIASWNCCINGVTTNSPAVNVTSGDEIYGSITSSCPPGTLSCATWNVLTLDLSTGQSTTLSNTPSEGQAFNWAFGGVLEAYFIVRCDDYPSDRQLTFEKIRVFDQNLHPILNPKWTKAVDSAGTPQCDYAVRKAPRRVTLDY